MVRASETTGARPLKSFSFQVHFTYSMRRIGRRITRTPGSARFPKTDRPFAREELHLTAQSSPDEKRSRWMQRALGTFQSPAEVFSRQKACRLGDSWRLRADVVFTFHAAPHIDGCVLPPTAIKTWSDQGNIGMSTSESDSEIPAGDASDIRRASGQGAGVVQVFSAQRLTEDEIPSRGGVRTGNPATDVLNFAG